MKKPSHHRQISIVGRKNEGIHALIPQYPAVRPSLSVPSTSAILCSDNSNVDQRLPIISIDSYYLMPNYKYTGMTCTAQEAYKMVQENANNPAFKIIDVRQHSEYQRGHLADAIPIPLDQLPKRLTDLSKDDTYLVVCQKGKTSKEAVQMLESKGYKAKSLQGGITAWSDLKYPLQLI